MKTQVGRLLLNGDQLAIQLITLKVLDELRRPPRIVDLVYLVAGIAITVLVQLVLTALGMKTS